MAVMGVKVS